MRALKRNHYQKLLLPLLGMAVIYFAIALVLRSIGLENAQAFIKSTGWWTPIVFVVLCALSLIAAPISGSSLIVVSGTLFGKELGWILSFIGSFVGCSANFWISRKLGRKFAARLLGNQNLRQLDRFTRRLQGGRDILYMILVMPIAQDLVSYAVGLTHIPYKRFLIALTVSGMAIVAAYIYLGSSLLEALI